VVSSRNELFRGVVLKKVINFKWVGNVDTGDVLTSLKAFWMERIDV